MFCQKCGNLLPETSNNCPNCGQSAQQSETMLPASLGKRFLNYLLDVIFLSILYYILYLIIDKIYFEILMFLIYYIFCETVWQKTVGKAITKTKVVMRDGSKPNFLHILGRTLCRYIPFEIFSFLTNKYPIGWHDKISGTLVVPQNYTAQDVQNVNNKGHKTSAGLIIALIIVVVVIVIGVMSTLAIVALNSARIKSRDAKRISDIAKQTLLISEQTNSKVVPDVKTILNKGNLEIKTYSVTDEIKQDKNNAKFINRFLDRNSEYKKLGEY